MEEEILYDLKKTANILGITYTQVYKYVNTCKKCNKNKKECVCDEFIPLIQTINVGDLGGVRIRHRVSSAELNKFIKSRKVKQKNIKKD